MDQDTTFYLKDAIGNDSSFSDDDNLLGMSADEKSPILGEPNTPVISAPHNYLDNTRTIPRISQTSHSNNYHNKRIVSLIRVLPNERKGEQICVFPLITRKDPSKHLDKISKSENDIDSSWLFDTNKSIDDVLSSPTTHAALVEAAEDNSGVIVVTPNAIGKEIAAHVTMETARCVSQVANLGTEDWLREYRNFDAVTWNDDEGYLDTLLKNFSQQENKKQHVVILSLGKNDLKYLRSLIQKLYHSLKLDHEQICTFSLLEIEHEKLLDRLNREKENLRIHHPDSHGGIVINLTQERFQNNSELELLLSKGLGGAKPRGHVVATLSIWPNACSKKLNRLSECAYLQVVHLIPASCIPDSNLRSKTSIRQSMSALGSVLRNVVYPGSEVTSYRRSILTKVLQRSIETRGYVVMIGSVAPDCSSHAATLYTLDYVHRLYLRKPGETARSPFDNSPRRSAKEIIGISREDLASHPAYLESVISDPRQRISRLDKRIRSRSPKRPWLPSPIPKDDEEYSYSPTNYLEPDPGDLLDKYFKKDNHDKKGLDNYPDQLADLHDQELLHRLKNENPQQKNTTPLSLISTSYANGGKVDFYAGEDKSDRRNAIDNISILDFKSERTNRETKIPNTSPNSEGSTFLKEDVGNRNDARGKIEESETTITERKYNQDGQERISKEANRLRDQISTITQKEESLSQDRKITNQKQHKADLNARAKEEQGKETHSITTAISSNGTYDCKMKAKSAAHIDTPFEKKQMCQLKEINQSISSDRKNKLENRILLDVGENLPILAANAKEEDTSALKVSETIYEPRNDKVTGDDYALQSEKINPNGVSYKFEYQTGVTDVLAKDLKVLRDAVLDMRERILGKGKYQAKIKYGNDDEQGSNGKAVDELIRVEAEFYRAEQEYKTITMQEKEEIEILEYKLERAMGKNGKLKAFTKETVSSTEKLQEEISQLKQKLKKSEFESENREEDYHRLIGINEKLQEEIELTQMNRNNIKVAHEKNEAVLLDREKKLSKVTAERDLLKQKIVRNSKEINDLRTEAENVIAIETQLKAKEEDLKHLRQSNENISMKAKEREKVLKRQVDEYNAEIEANKLEIHTLMKEITKYKQRFKDERKYHQMFRQTAKDEQNALELMLDELEMDRNKLQEQYVIKLSEIGSIELESCMEAQFVKRMERASFEIDRLRAVRYKLSEEIVAVQSSAYKEIDEKDRTIQQLSLKVNYLKTELSSSIENLEELKRNNRELEKIIHGDENLSTRLTTVDEELAKIRSEISNLLFINLYPELSCSKEKISIDHNKRFWETLRNFQDRIFSEITKIAEYLREAYQLLEVERKGKKYLRVEYDSLKERFEGLQSKERVDCKDMDRIMMEKSEILKKSVESGSKVKKYEMHIEDLEYELEQLKQCSNDKLLLKLREEIRSVHTSNLELSKRIESLTAERDNLKGERDNLCHSIQDLKIKTRHDKEVLAQLRLENEENKNSVEIGKDLILELQQKLQIASSSTNELLKKVREDNISYQKKNSELEDVVKQLEEEKGKSRLRLKKTQAEAREFEVSKNKLTESIENLSSKLHSNETTIHNLQQKLNLAENNSKGLELDTILSKQLFHKMEQKYKNTLSDTSNREKKLEVDLERMRKEQEILQTKLKKQNNSENERQNLKIELDKVRHEYEISHVKHHELSEKAENAKALEGEVERLLKENKALILQQDALTSSVDKAPALENHLEMLQLQHQELQNEQSKKNETICKLELEVSSLKQERKEFLVQKSKLSKKTKEVSELNRQVHKLQQEQETFRKQNVELKDSMLKIQKLEQEAKKLKKDREVRYKIDQGHNDNAKKLEILTDKVKQLNLERKKYFAQQTDLEENKSMVQVLKLEVSRLHRAVKDRGMHENELVNSKAEIQALKIQLQKERNRNQMREEQLKRSTSITNIPNLEDDTSQDKSPLEKEQIYGKSTNDNGSNKSHENDLIETSNKVHNLQRQMEKLIKLLTDQPVLSEREMTCHLESTEEKNRFEEASHLVSTIAKRAKVSMEQRDKVIQKLQNQLVHVSEQKESEIQTLKARFHDLERSILYKEEQDWRLRSKGKY